MEKLLIDLIATYPDLLFHFVPRLTVDRTLSVDRLQMYVFFSLLNRSFFLNLSSLFHTFIRLLLASDSIHLIVVSGHPIQQNSCVLLFQREGGNSSVLYTFPLLKVGSHPLFQLTRYYTLNSTVCGYVQYK